MINVQAILAQREGNDAEQHSSINKPHRLIVNQCNSITRAFDIQTETQTGKSVSTSGFVYLSSEGRCSDSLEINSELVIISIRHSSLWKPVLILQFKVSSRMACTKTGIQMLTWTVQHTKTMIVVIWSKSAVCGLYNIHRWSSLRSVHQHFYKALFRSTFYSGNSVQLSWN